MRVLLVGFGRLDELYGVADLAPHLHVVGIDAASDRMKSWARELKEFPHLRALAMDADRMDFEEAYFDAVLAFHTLPFVKEPQAVLGAFARVLKPGGLFAADFAFASTSPNHDGSLLGEKSYLEKSVPFHRHPESNWQSLAEAATWQDSQWTTTGTRRLWTMHRV